MGPYASLAWCPGCRRHCFPTPGKPRHSDRKTACPPEESPQGSSEQTGLPNTQVPHRLQACPGARTPCE